MIQVQKAPGLSVNIGEEVHKLKLQLQEGAAQPGRLPVAGHLRMPAVWLIGRRMDVATPFTGLETGPGNGRWT